jgi:dCMP deaminase
LTILKSKFIFAHAKAARIYADLSYCVRLKVGAVIVKNNTPIAIGYNGMPSGEPNVCELPDGTTDPRVRHAEINALRKLIKSHESAEESMMFVTHAPCINCAIEIYEAGITTLVFEKEYRDTSGIEFLRKKGVTVYRVDVDAGHTYEYISCFTNPVKVTGEEGIKI